MLVLILDGLTEMRNQDMAIQFKQDAVGTLIINVLLPYLCPTAIGIWRIDGTLLWRGKELATLPPNAVVQYGTSPKRCSMTLISIIGLKRFTPSYLNPVLLLAKNNFTLSWSKKRSQS